MNNPKLELNFEKAQNDEDLEEFFKTSPLFEEDRKREEEEIKMLDDIIMRNTTEAIMKCNRCKSGNVILKRLLVIRKNEYLPLVYYCLNCHSIVKYV